MDRGKRKLRAAIYCRVSTIEQKTLPAQLRELRRYVSARGWELVQEESEIGSGASVRPKREKILAAARARKIDVIVCTRLDRFGRSTLDLLSTLQNLSSLGVAFVCVAQDIDMTTPAGRVMVGMLALFAEFERDLLRERVREGLADARSRGKRLGRPATARRHKSEVRRLLRAGKSKSEIARELGISRASVIRMSA